MFVAPGVRVWTLYGAALSRSGDTPIGPPYLPACLSGSLIAFMLGCALSLGFLHRCPHPPDLSGPGIETLRHLAEQGVYWWPP